MKSQYENLVLECSGLCTKYTRDYLGYIIKDYSPDIIFLAETKISERRAKNFVQRYAYPNSLIVSSNGLAGGLILLWKHGFLCDIVCSKDNMIHLLLTSNPSKQECLLLHLYIFETNSVGFSERS